MILNVYNKKKTGMRGFIQTVIDICIDCDKYF